MAEGEADAGHQSLLQSTNFDEQRENIIFYYQVQGRELKDVQNIMQAKHNFVASESMYKKKIRQWHIRRSLTAAEKRVILAELASRRMDVNQSRQVFWQGKSVSISLLSRFRREQQGRHRMSWVPDEGVEPSTQIERPLRLPAETRHITLILDRYPSVCEASATSQIATSFATPAKSLHALQTLQDYCSIANHLAVLGRFSATRFLLNQAGISLFQLSSVSPSNGPPAILAFLPMTLGTLQLMHPPVAGSFNAVGAFYRHCVALLAVRLGAQNALVEVLCSFWQIEDKARAYSYLSESVAKAFGKLDVDVQHDFTQAVHDDEVLMANEDYEQAIRAKTFSCSTNFITAHAVGSQIPPALDVSENPHWTEHLLAKRQELGPLHRTTLSKMSNQAWSSLIQQTFSHTSTNAKSASQLFDDLIDRLHARQTMDSTALAINGPHEGKLSLEQSFLQPFLFLTTTFLRQ